MVILYEVGNSWLAKEHQATQNGLDSMSGSLGLPSLYLLMWIVPVQMKYVDQKKNGDLEEKSIESKKGRKWNMLYLPCCKLSRTVSSISIN
jgi:hypothetical protein